MAVDTIFSLKILLLLSYQSPEDCFDEIDNLFKLLSKHITNFNETLISQYIIFILSILSNNSKFTKILIFYFRLILAIIDTFRIIAISNNYSILITICR